MLPDIWDFSTISCQEEGEFGFYRWIRKSTLAQKAVIHLGQGAGTQGLCSDAQTQGAGLPQCSLPGEPFPSSDWGHTRWEQQGLQPSRGAQLKPWAVAAVPQAGWARCRGAVRTGGQAAEGTLLLTLPLLERIARALCSQMLATVSSTSSYIIAFSIPRKPWDRHRYLIIIVNPTQSSTQNYLH